MIKIKPIFTILSNNTMMSQEEKNEARKKNIQSIADKVLELFYDKLNSGQIKIKSTNDFERIAKLALALQGEAGEIIQTVEEPSIIDIDKSDETVKELYEKLYKQLNEQNS